MTKSIRGASEGCDTARVGAWLPAARLGTDTRHQLIPGTTLEA